MNKDYYAVIMAGGIGSRFWPISTQQIPKQFHDVLGTGETLIQKTFHRLEALIPSKNILISTNAKYEDLVTEQLPKITKRQLLLEPAMRNTAPCILYAALKIYQENPNAIILIASSDHWIDNETEFIKNIDTSFKACAEKNILMTLGIKPSSPNTGYGYIQFKRTSSEIKKVLNFTEKPDIQTADKFVNSGDYLWNAGIFVWSAKSIVTAFKNHLPEMYTLLSQGNKFWNTDTENDFIDKNYAKSENISIDFGIMEKADNVYVLPVDFGWSDLGTWGSLYKKLPKDSEMNATLGSKAIYRNAHGNMVKTQNNKRVVIQGLNDYIVIEKDDVILICPKKDEQDIKNIVANVKDEFGNEFV